MADPPEGRRGGYIKKTVPLWTQPQKEHLRGEGGDCPTYHFRPRPLIAIVPSAKSRRFSRATKPSRSLILSGAATRVLSGAGTGNDGTLIGPDLSYDPPWCQGRWGSAGGADKAHAVAIRGGKCLMTIVLLPVDRGPNFSCPCFLVFPCLNNRYLRRYPILVRRANCASPRKCVSGETERGRSQCLGPVASGSDLGTGPLGSCAAESRTATAE